MDNIMDFTAVHNAAYDPNSAVLHKAAIPDYNSYGKIINNWEISKPNLKETGKLWCIYSYDEEKQQSASQTRARWVL